jgi:hypothetical protein
MHEDRRQFIHSKNLATRLQDLETAVSKSNSRPEVCAYARAVMRELIIPIEIVNNLNFLALQDTRESCSRVTYLTMAQEQLEVINQIALSTLRFCDDSDRE